MASSLDVQLLSSGCQLYGATPCAQPTAPLNRAVVGVASLSLVAVAASVATILLKGHPTMELHAAGVTTAHNTRSMPQGRLLHRSHAAANAGALSNPGVTREGHVDPLQLHHTTVCSKSDVSPQGEDDVAGSHGRASKSHT